MLFFEDAGELWALGHLVLVLSQPARDHGDLTQGVRVNLNLNPNCFVFYLYNLVAAIRVVEESKEFHRKDIEVLLVLQPKVLLILGVITLSPSVLDLLLEVRIIHFPWLRSLAVDKVSPLTHPLDGYDEIAVTRHHIGLLTFVGDPRVIIFADVILVYVVLYKFLMRVT